MIDKNERSAALSKSAAAVKIETEMVSFTPLAVSNHTDIS